MSIFVNIAIFLWHVFVFFCCNRWSDLASKSKENQINTLWAIKPAIFSSHLTYQKKTLKCIVRSKTNSKLTLLRNETLFTSVPNLSRESRRKESQSTILKLTCTVWQNTANTDPSTMKVLELLIYFNSLLHTSCSHTHIVCLLHCTIHTMK